MALPPYYPSLFTTVNDWTFSENSSVANSVAIDPSYLVTAGDGAQVFRSKPAEGPSLTGLNSFVPDVGRPYYLRTKVRKTVAQTNGVPSWLRPGFIAYPFAPADYATGIVVFGPTFGAGLIAPNDFVDTASWVIGQWYEIGCYWVPDQVYPEARPRIRVNRSGVPDGIPYSDAVYEIESFEVLPQISMQDIQTEFQGPIPSPLSAYYRKTVQTESTANIVDQSYEYDCMYNSEIGNHPSTFANNFQYHTTDYGTFIPRGYGPAEMSFPTVAPYGKVLQLGNGTISWGGISQARSFAEQGYFKLETGSTYNFSTTRRLLTDPTTTHGNVPYQTMGLYLFDINQVAVGSIEAVRTQITAASGWQTLTGSKTYADVIAATPTAYYARWFSYDNIYDFTDPDTGTYNYYLGDQQTQIASCGVTKSSGSFVGTGLSRIYDIRDKTVIDRVGTVWNFSTTETFDDLGIRTITNPITHKVFNVGDFYVVDRPYTQRIPTIGPISFSDFLGQKRAAGPIWQTASNQGNKNCGDPINLTVVATSDDGLPITYRSVDIPPYYTLDANTGVITGNVPYVDIALTYQGFTISATDGFLVTSRSFSFSITNRAPTWNTSATLTGGTSYSQQFSATDPEGRPVKYLLASGTLPPGTTLTAQGLLSGTTSTGVYTFELAANDNWTSAFRTFTLTIS